MPGTDSDAANGASGIDAAYRASGTNAAYGARGTNAAYGASAGGSTSVQDVFRGGCSVLPILLHSPYALSCTDIRYAATRRCTLATWYSSLPASFPPSLTHFLPPALPPSLSPSLSLLSSLLPSFFRPGSSSAP
eukprot:3937897-Rhodomonas_salina.2